MVGRVLGRARNLVEGAVRAGRGVPHELNAILATRESHARHPATTTECTMTKQRRREAAKAETVSSTATRTRTTESGPPFVWDPARRFQLRCDLDAAFFHLYGIARDDIAYVMDTFPIVRRHDESAFGEYRTKRVVLEVYDALAKAAASGKPYVSPLGPPRRASR
jgi:hypothetical protein